MIIAVVIVPIVTTLLWLLCIRPYSLRNGKGYTPGGNVGVTFWVDWQQAQEIAKAKGDRGMILICRIVFWLHVVFIAVFAYSIFNSNPN
jgi:hypothetical protein